VSALVSAVIRLSCCYPMFCFVLHFLWRVIITGSQTSVSDFVDHAVPAYIEVISLLLELITNGYTAVVAQMLNTLHAEICSQSLPQY